MCQYLTLEQVIEWIQAYGFPDWVDKNLPLEEKIRQVYIVLCQFITQKMYEEYERRHYYEGWNPSWGPAWVDPFS